MNGIRQDKNNPSYAKFMFIKTLILPMVFYIFFFNEAIGQEKCYKLRNKDAKKIYQMALSNYRFNQKEAARQFQKLIEMEPDFVDSYFYLAEINYVNAVSSGNDASTSKQYEENYYQTAEKYFNKVLEICPSFQQHATTFYLGEYNYTKRNFDKSKTLIEQYMSYNSDDSVKVNRAKTILSNLKTYYDLVNHPVPFNPINLKGVNTEADEYLPFLSPDGEMIFYTHRFYKRIYSEIKTIEEFNFAKKIKRTATEEVYTDGEPMPEPFNQGQNQGGASITIDNLHMYITICDLVMLYHSSYYNCDIYSSDNINGKWSTLKSLGPNINGPNTWEGQPSISADGQTLYFASARDGGYGGLDIYCSQKDSTGAWCKAKNLGPTINTTGDDKTPYIHTDNQTLYFSSNGRLGMGGFDIYYATKLPDGTWTKPKNIGYPINTEGDEVAFTVSADGQRIYFASNKLNGKGGWDIYSSVLYDEARPKQILFVKGQVTDIHGKVLPNAKVELTNLNTLEQTESTVDNKTGHYAVAVPVKKEDEFLLTAKLPGYMFKSEYINPNTPGFEIPTTIDFGVEPVEVGRKIKLEYVNFETDSYLFDKVSKVILNYLAQFLQQNLQVNIKLQGHTDDVGSDDHNMTLSKQRAKAVYDYLTDKGIDTKRMSYAGFGEHHPVATNKTEEGRALNRRTEFIIIKK